MKQHRAVIVPCSVSASPEATLQVSPAERVLCECSADTQKCGLCFVYLHKAIAFNTDIPTVMKSRHQRRQSEALGICFTMWKRSYFVLHFILKAWISSVRPFSHQHIFTHFTPIAAFLWVTSPTWRMPLCVCVSLAGVVSTAKSVGAAFSN